MSVFGGDSWAREAQNRKRRVDDLVVEGLDGSSYKKLSSGKYACLVCPHKPVLDSPIMLSMHCKRSGHRKAESKLKERELMRQDEMNKRVALSEFPTATADSSTSRQTLKSVSNPLIEETRKAILEVLSSRTCRQSSKCQNSDVKSSWEHVTNLTANCSRNSSFPALGASEKVVAGQPVDFRERQEKELKFTAAGWKRDCGGKWYKDENVEFDSDEEDPNVCLS